VGPGSQGDRRRRLELQLHGNEQLLLVGIPVRTHHAHLWIERERQRRRRGEVVLARVHEQQDPRREQSFRSLNTPANGDPPVNGNMVSQFYNTVGRRLRAAAERVIV
jgi:hypothetical protein